MPLSPTLQQDSFWSLPVSHALTVFKTDAERGLSESESRERLRIFGVNVIEKPRRTSGFFIFANQFKSPLIAILLVAAFVTLVIGNLHDALFILAAVFVNSALGFFQEYKAERALAELETYLKQRARVIRDGVEHEIDAAYLVPGDLIRLAQGDRVPADARLLFVNDLHADEAVLTGESLPVSKASDPVSMDAGIGDQRSMVFAGTLLTQGVGTAVVCRTDFATELGKIAALVASSRTEPTPLQGAIRRFSFGIGVFLVLLTALVFGVGVARGYSVIDMFITSVAIAVSAVPEGLPIAMTVILAIGVQRMAARKGVVRRLVAAEALGSVTVILTDKTGTLTMAQMVLHDVIPFGKRDGDDLLRLALLNTDVLIENPEEAPQQWRMNGRVIETSLVRSAALRGIRVDGSSPAVLESLPFSAARKFSACVIDSSPKRMMILLGAPDVLLERVRMSSSLKEKILAQIDALASSGALVLGVASRALRTKTVSWSDESSFEGLTFEGLITLRDPVRPGVPDALRSLHRAGIRTVIMTGDHRGTALAVARAVGMDLPEGSVIDATELRMLSDEAVISMLSRIYVVARVSPEDKLRMVRLYQRAGEVVAMTGDGVNDAPSIKQADIGIAMGSGTAVARDVADLVLLDDNYETIAAAAEEGRQVIHNIRKVMVYLLSNVADALFLIGGSLLMGLTLPLSALQILWVNFFADSFPAVAFAFERDGGLSGKPYRLQEGLFDPLMRFLILFIGIATSALLFFLYWFLLREGYHPDLVRTFIFACFGSYTLIVAFPVRSLEKSIFEYPAFSNRYLLAGAGIGIVLMALSIYLPFFQSLFNTVSLPLVWILGVIAVWVINIAAIEFGKWLFRKDGVRV